MAYRSVLFVTLRKIHAENKGFLSPQSWKFRRLGRGMSLERNGLVGLGLFLTVDHCRAPVCHSGTSFGALETVAQLRAPAPILLLMTRGVQSLMAGMVLGVLSAGIRRI